MIIENDIDNFLFYKSNIIRQRSNESLMHLTVAPTMDCCFRCHYCFEEFKDKDYISEEVMNSIVKYMNSLTSEPNFILTWFGGEPLMAIDQMKQLYKKIEEQYKKPIYSNIITTGYHINEKVITILQEIGITQMQITLDGLKETHNKVKFISECNDVFNKTLDNVELLLRTSNIHVTFRINLTECNKHEYIEVYQYLLNRFKHFKRIGISPGFIMDRGSCLTDKSSLFSRKKATQFILDLYNKHSIHTPFIKYPSQSFNECAIKNVMSMSFDPNGYAYKCWEIIGDTKYAIGKLNTNGEIDNINQIIYNRHLYGADPLEDEICSTCKFLPICNGGCPIQRIENKFENKDNDCCTFYKGKMEEFLKIHLKLKQTNEINIRE